MDDSHSLAATDAVAGCGPLAPLRGTAQTPLKRQVYAAIRALGAVSRVELARYLSISPASVTTAVSELQADGLVTEREAGPRESGRGRPPVALSVKAAAGYVLGAKLGDAVHSAVVLDLQGRVLGTASLGRTRRRGSAEGLAAEFVEVARKAAAASGIKLEQVLACGVGLPGGIDHARGRAVWSPLLAETDVAFRALAEAKIGRPVAIDNDANLVALAELWFGGGREMANFAVITIEHGVGMGVVIDHRLNRGGQGLGLELGHTKVQLDGALCRCGRRGCLEAYVADYALVREASTALDWQPTGGNSSQILLESLFDQAKAGNEAARAIFRRAGRYLALGIANVVNLFDPETIILAGERMRYDYLYADDVLAEMQDLTLNSRQRATRVEINAWGDTVWARGAATLAMDIAADLLIGHPA